MAPTPDEATTPTPEQTSVIEQPIGGSVLVIAGAGSGKTETMANRVVWLVANGLASPSEILGLTFTRKAAGELGERITSRLQRFTERLSELAGVRGALAPAELERARDLSALLSAGLDLPQVSTYNSFASSIVQEFGPSAGLATSGTVIDEATAWRIAREVVCASAAPGLAEGDVSIGTLVARVLRLDHAISENLTDVAHVRAATKTLRFVGALPYNEKKSEGQYKDIGTILTNLDETELVARLVEAFSAEKRRRQLIEFSDQLALAVQTLRSAPETGRVLRKRTPIVLLDEVQDTSVGQTTLLSMIFGGLSVMAVGDPHQSIYGFRGASASNLQTFHRDFAGLIPRSSAPAGVTLSLSTSWRNPGLVLRAANAVSSPLATKLEAEASGLSVRPLVSRAQYLGEEEAETPPPLEVRAEETIELEFASLAAWVRDARNDHLARTGVPATAAVLFQRRSHMPRASDALWAAGVPNQIVGLGGLLSTPEVTDLICVLRSLWFADADSELIRLLAGPRYRIGVSDLQGLSQAASWFSVRDHTKKKLTDEDVAATPPISDPERSFTLVDTLDEIAAISDPQHRALENISKVGRVRLREAGRMLRSLRRDVGGDILSLIRSCTNALFLDIELDAAEHSGYDGSAAARANLESFMDLVETFLDHDEAGSLDAVLAWLERAGEDDTAAEHVPDPEPGTVQLITIHGSKGLEWDLVAVPRLVESEFPSPSGQGFGGLRPGELPDVLRGDAAWRPRLHLEAAASQKEVLDSVGTYQDALRDRHAEEQRRLAYVAITRAAKRLLLTYSFWGGQKKQRGPSVYLGELEELGLTGELRRTSAYEEDPSPESGRTLEWPLDPLGARAQAVRTAAERLRAELARSETDPQHRDASAPPLHPVVELLLSERAAEARVPDETALGIPGGLADRITASTFHEFIEHPMASDRRRRRPLPVRPYRRTRTGNLFHEWVERRSTTAIGTALTLPGLDEFGVSATMASATVPASEPNEDLDLLIDQFEKSRWANLQPIAVELEITLPFAGRTLVCKLDAIYRTEAAGTAGTAGTDETYEIVDWKSGRPPKNDRERNSRFLQLDLYRHAYARWAGIDPARISATLFYVAEGQELRAQQPRSFEELEGMWLTAADSLTG